MANQNQTKSAAKKSDKRNLKYGSLSLTITVIFVALVIILNIIATSLSAVQGWYTDMTASGFYSLSKDFKTEMNKLLNPENGDDVYINIVLLSEEDVFRSYNSFTVMLYQTFKELVHEFDHINLKAYNTTVHPELAEKYQTSALDTLALDDVVFELCDAEGNALFNTPAKKYKSQQFFMKNSDTGNYIGYNAETKILSAVALLTGKAEKPTAYYLQGHSEPTLAAAADWQEVLELGGFEVKELNLVEETIEKASEDDILIINCPKWDLKDQEVKMIRSFLGSNYGNLIVVEDANVPFLPILEDLLSEYALGFGNSVTDDAHSVSASGTSKIFADYSQTYNPNLSEQPMSGQILGKLFGKKNTNLPTTIFTTPKAVKIKDKTEIVAGVNASASSFALLQSYSTAQTTNTKGEIEKGSVPLLGVSRIIWELNDGNMSYVVALSSADFLSNEYASSSVNRDIMLELLRLMWDNTISYDNIDYKQFDDTALTNVSTAAANTWTIVCVAVIPAVIALCGVIVYVRRRHS